jgi:hypothetical protein
MRPPFKRLLPSLYVLSSFAIVYGLQFTRIVLPATAPYTT